MTMRAMAESSPERSRTEPYELLIDGGTHDGAATRLRPGIYRVGGRLDSDIMLADPDILDEHMLLELDGDQVRVETLDGTAAINGERLAPGKFVSAGFPSALSIGGTRITLRHQTSRPLRERRRARFMSLTIGTLAILFTGGYTAHSSFGSRPLVEDDIAGAIAAPVGIHPAIEHALAAPSLPGRAETPDDRAEAAADPSAALRKRLAAIGLDHLIMTGKPGRIEVEGAIPADSMPAWQETRAWFDSHFGAGTVLQADVRETEGEGRPDFTIQAISAGPNPYIIAGGDRYPVGATIARRWRVVAISQNRIVVETPDGRRANIAIGRKAGDHT